MKPIPVLIVILLLSFQLRAQFLSFDWAKSSQGVENSSVTTNSIATDADGNIYTTGWFDRTVDFDPGPGTENHTSKGWVDIYLRKLDSSGNLLWVKSLGSSLNDIGTSVLVAPSGSIYLIGNYTGTVDFDPGQGTLNSTSKGDKDIFVNKLNSQGELIWHKTFGGQQYDQCVSACFDKSFNLILIGSISAEVNFGSSYTLTPKDSRTNFLFKLDSNGNTRWAKLTAGRSESIAIDSSGKLLLTGSFYGTAEFERQITSVDRRDAFVSKLDTAGRYLWTRTIGGYYNDYGFSIATDADMNVIVTGIYEGQVDLDPGITEHIRKSQGEADIFVMKLTPSGELYWVHSIGSRYDTRSYSLAIDSSGNSYITGWFQHSLQFEGRYRHYNLTSKGAADLYLVKIGPHGRIEMAQSFGAERGDYGSKMVLGRKRSIYLAGLLQGTMDFDPGQGTFYLDSKGSRGAFLVKLKESSVASVKNASDFNPAIIYPNPGAGSFTINPGKMAGYLVKVLSPEGKIVYESHSRVDGLHEVRLDSPAGLYYVVLTGRDAVLKYPIVIHR